MEIVSNKLTVSAPCSPQGSQRSLERTGTFAQHPRRWNTSTTLSQQQRTSHRRRESLSANSLLSLKAYYRKLRTFKGTIKALISFRRMPTFSARFTSDTLPPVAAVEEQGEESEAQAQDRERARVAKLTDNDAALQTVQNQVKDLVEKGHVVTELNGADKQDVAYRMQGNLDLYTEENLHKRLTLQEHPRMVALTQRLWLSAVHEQEDHLSFGEYEAYMLRLHRLILPEFDLTQSKALIKDDWTRDTDGRDALDYRFFHFSMFELVDLWTDTVEVEDYISLLYCIMHSLTFEWNGHHLLKALDDINPVDILNASKDMTMDEIERDLAREVDSDEAQLYRDRIASGDDETIHDGCEEDIHHDEAVVEQPALATDGSDWDASEMKTRTADPLMSSRGSRATTSRAGVNQHNGVVFPRSSSTSRSSNAGRQLTREDSRSTGGVNSLQARSSESDPAADVHGRVSSNQHIQSRGSRIASGTYTGPRVVLSPASGNQYVSGTNGEASSISITSLGSGGEFLNMMAKPSYLRKPSALASGIGSRQLSNHPSASGDQAIFGLGLHNGQSSARHLPTYEPSIPLQSPSEAMPLGVNSTIVSGQGLSSTRATKVGSPRSPQSLRANAKENETRQGSLLVGGEQYQGSAPTGHGKSSPRTRSARRSPSSSAQQSHVVTNNERPSASGAGMLPVALDLQQLGTLTAYDPSALLVGGGLQSSRMSILARPPNSSSSPTTTFLGSANGLNGSLRARSYQDSASSPTRPAAQGSRVYHQRSSQASIEDLAVMSLGGQQLPTGSPRLSSPTRSITASSTSSHQGVFAGSIVGSNSLTFEPRSATPRSSMAKLPSARRIDSTDRNRISVGVDLGLSGASARLSVHKETPLSLRATVSKRPLPNS